MPGKEAFNAGTGPEGLSARATRRYGLLLGALLGAALVAILVMDRDTRIEEAGRQVSTLAVGARGQLFYALRDAERALQSAAGVEAGRRQAGAAGGLQAPGARLSMSLAAHPELRNPVIVDGGASAIADWDVARAPGRSPMRFGQPRKDVDGTWVLPLAVRLPGEPQAWLAADFGLGALQVLVERIQRASGGPTLISVIDNRGYVLARTPELPGRVGARIEDAEFERRIASGVDSIVDLHDHRDGIQRLRAYQASMYFPLRVATGVPSRHVLLPWYVLAVLGVLGYALYWAGFLHLMRIVRRSEASQAHLLEQIGRSGELLAFALRAGKMGAWAMRADRSLWWSDEVGTLYGLDQANAEVDERLFHERLHPEDRALVLEKLEALRERGEDLWLDYRVLAADGSVRHLSTRGAMVRTPGSEILTSGVVMDITAQVEARHKLLDTERQFRLLFERNPLPFWVFDIETLRFLEVNQAAVASYGYSREDFLSMTLHDIRPGRESPRLLADLAERGRGERSKVWVHRRKDGSEIEVLIHASDIDFAGRTARLVLAEDVTERRRAEHALSYRASHDLLTGLPNETAFGQRLQQMVEGAGDAPIDVVRVALRRHALVNDSLGAGVGDEVLLQAARRLRALLPESAVVARAQGAEFLLAAPASAGHPGGEALLDALCTSLGEPVWAGDAPHYLDASFGLAIHPGDGASADALVRNAGLAVHAVGQQPSTDRVRYSAALGGQITSRLAMLARLHQAIAHGGFELHYQPIFDLASGEACGYEALARWPQPDGSYVSPGEFIPLCEDSALIVPFGRWVMQEAGAAWRSLAAIGRPPLPISVNVSVTQFARSDLVDELRQVIAAFDLPVGALELELTEGVVMNDPEHVIATLSELRAMGARLAIDDFGTGYSNLSYLRRLPVHTLKIDRVFVQDVESDTHNAQICRSVISLAAMFDMQVTAEGIETREQLDWFRANGGHKAQGFLLGRPAPLSTLLRAAPRVPEPMP